MSNFDQSLDFSLELFYGTCWTNLLNFKPKLLDCNIHFFVAAFENVGTRAGSNRLFKKKIIYFNSEKILALFEFFI